MAAVSVAAVSVFFLSLLSLPSLEVSSAGLGSPMVPFIYAVFTLVESVYNSSSKLEERMYSSEFRLVTPSRVRLGRKR